MIIFVYLFFVFVSLAARTASIDVQRCETEARLAANQFGVIEAREVLRRLQINAPHFKIKRKSNLRMGITNSIYI